MAVLGYVVQYSNEDDYTVYHGFLKLFRHFSDALENANDQYRGFMETYPAEHFDGPFHVHKPTKKECDAQGSVLVFESKSFIVWIDCVVE
jgi:hypothetical protein